MPGLFPMELLIAFLWLLGTVAINMVSVYALVRSDGFRRLVWDAISIGAIICAFYCLRHAVLVIPLAVAYALWCVFGIFGVILMSSLCFRQKLTPNQCKGIVLLVLGIICISLA